jgi:hypothetical protein
VILIFLFFLWALTKNRECRKLKQSLANTKEKIWKKTIKMMEGIWRLER